jgi:hypothetical protein
MPFAPALASQGIVLERVAVVNGDPGHHPRKLRLPGVRARTDQQDTQFPGDPGIWAFEQALGSGACDAALAWAARCPRPRELRRLQLAAERGHTLGVLFRPRRAVRQPSAAVLRLTLEPASSGVRVTLLKGRSMRRGTIDLAWPGS